MKTTRGLFARLIDPEHLEHCARLTTRGKRRRNDVARFLFRQEEILQRLLKRLRNETWCPQGFKMHRIRDPKPRLIACAPVEDRVVHTALEGGRGLYASPQARAWTGLGPDWPPPNQGLPMGALTSQFLATHVNLCGLDHFIKRELKVPGYLRYVDDLLLLGDTRADLRRWRCAVGTWLWERRHLRLKHPKARILSCAGHLDVLGHRVTRGEHRPLPRTWRRYRRRVSDALQGRPGPAIRDSVAASVGLLLAGTGEDIPP